MVMSDIRFDIVEDTITEYLDFISESFKSNSPKELKKQARILTGEYGDEHDGYIAPNMTVARYGEFNPNLFMSGQEEEYWNLYANSNPHGLMGGKNSIGIEISYTGARLHQNYGDEAKVWWEFAEGNEGNPEERILERDYAFYQETGIDKIARPKDARATGAIATGVHEAKDELLDHSAKYLLSILKKQNGDIPPKLI